MNSRHFLTDRYHMTLATGEGGRCLKWVLVVRKPFVFTHPGSGSARALAERVSERRSAVLLPGVGTNLPEGFSFRHVPISLEKDAASRWPSTPTRRECSSRRRNCCHQFIYCRRRNLRMLVSGGVPFDVTRSSRLGRLRVGARRLRVARSLCRWCVENVPVERQCPALLCGNGRDKYTEHKN
jgi:hypothetical protein